MKKLLLLILVAILLVSSVYVVFEGMKIGEFEILGIKGIKSKNDQLDQKIQQATRLAEKDYIQKLAQIDEDAKMLNKEKTEYEEMTEISTGDEVIAANQLDKYEYESLMIKLGNHATNKGAIAKIDVMTGEATGIYNLKFTATGSYISITDFISAIENDSTLGFKIENFAMSQSSSGDTLQATFICRGVSIKGISQITSSAATSEQQAQQQATSSSSNNSTSSSSSSGNNQISGEFDGLNPNKSTGNGNINNVKNDI